MPRCDFGCGQRSTDIIRIRTAWHQSCSGHADKTEHSDRMVATRAALRRAGILR